MPNVSVTRSDSTRVTFVYCNDCGFRRSVTDEVLANLKYTTTQYFIDIVAAHDCKLEKLKMRYSTKTYEWKPESMGTTMSNIIVVTSNEETATSLNIGGYIARKMNEDVLESMKAVDDDSIYNSNSAEPIRRPRRVSL